MTADPARCARCGGLFHIDALDAKPSSLPGYRGFDQIYRLEQAADAGEDFDRLECADCYGPGYSPGNFKPKGER